MVPWSGRCNTAASGVFKPFFRGIRALIVVCSDLCLKEPSCRFVTVVVGRRECEWRVECSNITFEAHARTVAPQHKWLRDRK